MRNKVRIFLLFFLIGMQIIVNRYASVLNLNLDLIFLILVYFAIKSDFYRCILVATVIGLVTDYISMNIFGVFGFSRTVIAFGIFGFVRFLDLQKKSYIFFLVFGALMSSNFIASLFFYLIRGIKLDIGFLVISPLLTGIFAVILLSFRKIRDKLNVY